MAKFKPLATLENGMISVDLEKMRAIIMKFEKMKPIEKWLHKLLVNALNVFPEGYILIFIRLNHVGAKVTFRIQSECGANRKPLYFTIFKGRKCRIQKS